MDWQDGQGLAGTTRWQGSRDARGDTGHSGVQGLCACWGTRAGRCIRDAPGVSVWGGWILGVCRVRAGLSLAAYSRDECVSDTVP